MPPSTRIGDVQVYEADASTLEPGCWLNDGVIAYLLELFQSRRQPACAELVVLEPTTTFTAAMVGDADVLHDMFSEKAGRAIPLTQQLLGADLVVMPVSNNEDADAAGGGSHWSLLIFRRGEDGTTGRYEHYDSCNNANAANARALMAATAPLLFPAGSQPPRMQLARMTTPQQANGFDCGVYALAISEIVCAGPTHRGAAPPEAVTAAVRSLTPEAVAGKRAEWLALLRSAMK
jgi:sentrin-specific protease 8